MVATITIYANTTVIMAMIGTTTMIMVVSKTMIMTMVATMTKNMTINMAKIFKQVQKDNFYCLLIIIKVYENSICTSSLKNTCFFSLLSLLNLSVQHALPHKKSLATFLNKD